MSPVCIPPGHMAYGEQQAADGHSVQPTGNPSSREAGGRPHRDINSEQRGGMSSQPAAKADHVRHVADGKWVLGSSGGREEYRV
jgi:hypothetical protein